MANYAALKSAIQQAIKTNENNEITGALLQQVLLSMVNSLGVGCLYMGMATPTTNPGTPDQNVFYFATEAGTYSNFGGIVLSGQELAILCWDGEWHLDTITIASQSGPFIPGTGTNSVQQKGTGAEATGAASVAEGSSTIASGDWSHAEGFHTTASERYSHAEGANTIASGASSHAEGVNTVAGVGDRPEVSTSTNAGSYAHAEGNGTQASGNSAHAEGKHTLAEGSYSHAEGINTRASGQNSHAEGHLTKAQGADSHAEGASCESKAERSHVEGFHTETNNASEHAEGSYNKSNPNTRHSVGIGTSESTRKNAFEIMDNGDIYVIGLGGYDGTNPGAAGVQTLQQLLGGAIVKVVGSQDVTNEENAAAYKQIKLSSPICIQYVTPAGSYYNCDYNIKTDSIELRITNFNGASQKRRLYPDGRCNTIS